LGENKHPSANNTLDGQEYLTNEEPIKFEREVEGIGVKMKLLFSFFSFRLQAFLPSLILP
jgi:hypothetical protein